MIKLYGPATHAQAFVVCDSCGKKLSIKDDAVAVVLPLDPDGGRGVAHAHAGRCHAEVAKAKAAFGSYPLAQHLAGLAFNFQGYLAAALAPPPAPLAGGTANCPDCGVPPGKLHEYGCDVERCPDCGGQKISCDCDGRKRPRIAWSGLWPGEAECEEFGWYSKMVPGKGWTPCAKDDPGAGPDLNRLAREAKWDAEHARFVLPVK